MSRGPKTKLPFYFPLPSSVVSVHFSQEQPGIEDEELGNVSGEGTCFPFIASFRKDNLDHVLVPLRNPGVMEQLRRGNSYIKERFYDLLGCILNIEHFQTFF